ncbi:MAG: PadR family transcriptional regulator [Solirubrobacterales bacterium]
MAKRNKSKYALLGVLSLAPGSGYDIKKFCDISIAHFWNENYSRIYPVLKQLKQEGLVEVTAEQNEGRPTRNIYTITDVGRQELAEWLAEPIEEVPDRNELLLRLFFGNQLPLENTLAKLQEEKQKHQVLLANYERITSKLKPLDGTEETPFWFASVSWGLYYSRSKIAWCDETIELLTNHRNKGNRPSEAEARSNTLPRKGRKGKGGTGHERGSDQRKPESGKE